MEDEEEINNILDAVPMPDNITEMVKKLSDLIISASNDEISEAVDELEDTFNNPD